MQKDFINIAAHELRTPIQPILGFVEILKNKAKDENQKELLNIVSRNAKKLKQLTEDILQVSKIESQSLQLHKEYFNLSELVKDIIHDFKNQINKENKHIIKLELKSNGKEIIINADKSKVNQVIYNLLNNAVRFTIKKGKYKEATNNVKISITIESKGNQVTVTVKDNGQGIDEEILPKLFTKFATKSETGGTGLGLYISKSIVEQHGGRIWTEINRGIDKGAVFKFSLPVKN